MAQLFFLSLLTFLAAKVWAAKDADKVDYSGIINFNYTADVYSGYLMISDGTEGLHYIFYESQDDPTNDPLILWLNGGPGCSSFLGALQENGPWIFYGHTFEPVYNNYSWNLHMNVLYIESPAGVGFSYSSVNPENRTYDDPTVATSNLNAVLDWFQEFPEFKSNDFYVTGESYGGMYVPWLSAYIDNYNNFETTSDGDKLNFKGFAVGNGLTDLRYDFFGSPPSLWTAGFNYLQYRDYHTIFSLEMQDLLNNVCFQNETAPYLDVCQDAVSEITKAMENINIYNIYGECYIPSDSDTETFTYNQALFLNKHPILGPILKTDPPCLDITGPTQWLRNQTVRDAFNIPDFIQEWTECNDGVNENYEVSPEGSIWAYHQLVGKVKTMFYSGNVDASVPILGSTRWIDQMRIELDLLAYDLWSPWYIEDQNTYQVAGYVTTYQEGFTFCVVNGAGHMVPQYKPAQAYLMIENWVFDRSWTD